MLDREQAPAVGMAWHCRHLDGLAAERIRHIDILTTGVHDAVAEMTDMIDARVAQPRRGTEEEFDTNHRP